MAQDYFIISGKNRKGPYDLVMLVRKIRNGSLDSATLVQQDNTAPAKPALEWPELAVFLTEIKEERKEPAKPATLQRRNLYSALQKGWRFLQRTPVSTVLAGVWVLAVILMLGFTHFVQPNWARGTAYIMCFIFSHFLLSCYLFSVLRMTRSQPFGLSYLLERIVPSIEALLFSSTYVSITAILGLIIFTNAASADRAMIGMLVVAIPGFIILTLYVFAPLLVLDKGYGLWEAMEMSRKSVLSSGIENMGVLYALFVINFIAGLFIIMPMAITLPITMSALAEIYDESFV